MSDWGRGEREDCCMAISAAEGEKVSVVGGRGARG